MIISKDNCYLLNTIHTTYALRILPSGQIEHLYYGARLPEGPIEALFEKRAFALGNANTYDVGSPTLCPENLAQEFSTYGTGDLRHPSLFARNARGEEIIDFTCTDSEILTQKPELSGLPSAYYEEDDTEETLCITLEDDRHTLRVKLFYSVFEKCDVLTRRMQVENLSPDPVNLFRAASFTLDLQESGYTVHSFHGAWAREMEHYTNRIDAGCLELGSHTGTSSNRTNPFFMAAEPCAAEDAGRVYGFNLIYSGNHKETVEVNAYGKTRISAGISDEGFSWNLKAGECFDTPEAVLSFSKYGLGGLSRNMHDFVNHHIVRGFWKMKERPVLLNSWEAFYFKIDEAKLVNLAKKCKKAGIDLLVMDDGWFGKRDSDNCSLGDWTANKKKLPNGLEGLCKKVNAEGVDLGIWVEPEMVNEDSDLYRAHPDWVLGTRGAEQSLGRNQMLLDLGRKEVQDYIISCVDRILLEAPITYVKWDFNRIMSDVSVSRLSPEEQGQTAHEYCLGLYRVMKTLTEQHPKVLFEGCASGGNRFDLGILCYFPQIWASDDTDAYERTKIQQGYSYGYPQSAYTCHVSGIPNHQTLRRTPEGTRFEVACFGNLGYELNLSDVSEEYLEMVQKEVEVYKKYRRIFQYGDFYRLNSPYNNDRQTGTQWMVVKEDRSVGIGMLFNDRAWPNQPTLRFIGKGLDEEKLYHFYNIEKKVNIKLFGDLINMFLPVHIRQDSIVHNVASRYYKMEGEVEDVTASGALIMEAGICLAPSYGGTGFDKNVRNFSDYESRMYFMEENGMSERDRT